MRDDLPAANGCTMDHAGRRLFIDEFRPGGRLLEVDPAGNGEPAVLLDDLAGPNAPAMGPDGKLYFPQVFADEIWCYDLDSGEARLVAGDLPRPTAVKFDSRGRLVTSVAGAGRIVAIDLATGAQEVLAEVPLGIDNVSVGPGDRIFVSHYVDGRVAEETAGRQRVLSPPGLLGPHGLAVDGDGTILFADGLSVGAVVDGVAERHHRLLVDLPTLAIGVARFAGGSSCSARPASCCATRTGEASRPSSPAGCSGRRDPRRRRSPARRERAGRRASSRSRRRHDEHGARRTAAPASVDRLVEGRRRLRDRRRTGRARRRRRRQRDSGSTGSAMPRASRSSGRTALVADAARHELVLVDVAGGAARSSSPARRSGAGRRRRRAGRVRVGGLRRRRRLPRRLQRRRLDPPPHPDGLTASECSRIRVLRAGATRTRHSDAAHTPMGQPQSPSSHQSWAIWWRPPKYTPGPSPPPGSTLFSTPLTCGAVMTPHSAQFSQRL